MHTYAHKGILGAFSVPDVLFIAYVKVQKSLSTSPQLSGNGAEFGIRSHMYKVSSWPFTSFAYQEDS